MKITASKRIEQFGEGIFQVLNEKKREVEASGRRVYNFSVGTPDFKPANHIMEAVAKACLDPDNYKYALADLPQLTKAVIDRYASRYHVNGLTPEEIMCVYGSQEGIAHIGLSLIDEGDVVLVPDPGYPIFEVGPALAGAKVVPYELTNENDYLPDLDKIEKEWGKDAKVMIISYPLNPICKTAPASFYEKLIPWAKKNQIVIIHDNAYSDIIFDGREGRSILSFPGAKEVAVEFYSLSKSFNYTGARVSFVVGNKELVQNFKKLRSQIDYGTFLPVQYGALAALTGPDECVTGQCKEYERRRNALCDGLTKIGWKTERSEGTMFAWAKIPDKYQDDVEFVMTLLDKTGVLCTPGSSFGRLGKGHVRFALTMPVEAIEEAVRLIDQSGIL